MNERITIVAMGRTVTFTKAGQSEPSATITAGEEEDVTDDGVNSMFIFDLNTAGPNETRRDNSRCYMKLYGFKIYEDNDLMMDLVPIVNEKGEGGLRDNVSGQRFEAQDGQLFLSPDGEEAAASSQGITVYEGKLVFNETDQKLYKYTGGTFVEIGPIKMPIIVRYSWIIAT